MPGDVIVRDSKQDMELLFKQFPHLRTKYASNMRAGAFGKAPFNPNDRLPFEPEIEDADYITPAGKSSYRGSKAIVEDGTPAAVVRREYYSHPELINGHPRIIHPEVLNKVDKSRINFDAGPISGIPPKQDDYFTNTEEGKRMIKQISRNTRQDQPNRHSVYHEFTPQQGYPDDNYIEQPMYSGGRHDQMPHRDPSILQPLAKPWEPSSNDIIKVLGWNEGNMKLLTEVSKRMGRCSELLTKINSVNQEVDVDELMEALQYMDNEAFRKVFADIFQEQLKKYMDLSTEIQSYLSGKAVIEEDTPVDNPTDDTPSTSDGAIDVIPATDNPNSSSQDAPDDSVRPGTSEPSDESSTDSNEITG